jgi:hypothetical protein
MGKVRISEWLWRFIAAVMLFAVGWTMWIFYQLNAPSVITNAAYEAAAKANAKQNAQGIIAPAIVPAAAAALETAREPPINADKLKFSEGLSISDKK